MIDFDDSIIISIHALRVEGDFGRQVVGLGTKHISIHALRVEGDGQKWRWDRGGVISIHALRVEGDDGYIQLYARAHHFYPRPPGGGRRSYARRLRWTV